MNAVIIEDERLAADRLEEMIQEVSPDIRITAKIGSIREAVKWFMSHSADLIFLDIQLSDGLSFSIFDQVAVNTPVIFTTAYDQYAIKAFQLNSVAYLLKPVRKTELRESLDKLESLQNSFNIDFDRLAALLEGKKPDFKKRFLIQVGRKFRKIEISDIAYFFAQDKTIFLKTFQSQIFPIDHTLDMLEGLIDPERFFRINRKFFISMDAIQNMTAYSRSRIKLDLIPPVDSSDDTIVSIERSGDFRKWLNG